MTDNNDSQKTKYDLPRLVSLGLLLVILFAASIKNIRYAEYFQPALAPFVALVVSRVDWRKFLATLETSKSRIGQIWLPCLIAFTIAIIIPLHAIKAFASMHYAKRFFFNQYQIPLQAISNIAQPGDRVYHSMWDEFPVLFHHDQNLKYISGLDPTFLYKQDPELALEYQDLVFNRASSTQDQAWDLIHDRLRAKFVIIDSGRWPYLNNLIASDPRYLKLAEGDGGASYSVILR